MSQAEEYAAWMKFLDESMVVYMILSVYLDNLNDEEYDIWASWYDNVDMCTGAFGK